MSGFEELYNLVEILCSSDELSENQLRITEEVQRAEIKYIYWDERARRPYGEAKQIKRELAERFNLSVKTIEAYVYK